MAGIFEEADSGSRRADPGRSAPSRSAPSRSAPSRSAPSRSAPSRSFTVRTEDGERLNEGQLWLASLWFILTVALLPELMWPLLLSPALLGLGMFTVRAARAVRAEPHEVVEDRSVMKSSEAVLFGVFTSLMVVGLWVGGRGALFLLPIVAGGLFVTGRLLPGTWERLRDRRQHARAEQEAQSMLPGDVVSAMADGEQKVMLRSLCRASVRYTLEDASRALRLALTSRPRTEAELLSELGDRYGDVVARVVIDTAVSKRAVRRYGEHLALAMDGAYRAA